MYAVGVKRLFWITVLIFAQFGGGLCQVGSQIYPISENAKFGFADTTGKIVISPQFDWASDFHNGLARVEISGKKGFV
ncbi:MAG TPA: WG repeat-containing protein, partial [Pyrinomonadaceae bacterium]|nr:WG repeat-containing protein [Pyrinomonadaceae bacterium]